jgi:long-chain fatty acid transport protein
VAAAALPIPGYDADHAGGTMLALLLALGTADAASLDLLDVGGIWGTPGATNPTAVWWNPAGLALTQGTQLLAEGAPTIGGVKFDRTNPSYAPIDPEFAYDVDGDGEDDFETDYSGSESLRFVGVVPFIGVSTTIPGVKGLGLGAALYVPYARTGTSDSAFGPGRFNVRDGGIQVVNISLGAGYHIADIVAIGASLDMMESTWGVDVDTEYYTALGPEIAADPNLGGDGIPESFHDAYTEARGYTTNLQFDPLKSRRITFGAGVYITPSDTVGISIAYRHGANVSHTGGMRYVFSCPEDALSKIAAGVTGICNGEGADVRGKARISYRYPARVNLGVVLEPAPTVRLELMGGAVFWSQFSEYNIRTSVTDASQFDAASESRAEDTAALVSQDRKWARDNRNAPWFGVDTKVAVSPIVTVGGRLVVDTPAVPSEVLSTNNIDMVDLAMSGLAVFTPTPRLDIGLSYTRHQWVGRTVTDSRFSVATFQEKRTSDRYFYPEANGTYTGGVHRFALSLRGRFGKLADEAPSSGPATSDGDSATAATP